jgi:dimethylargininase
VVQGLRAIDTGNPAFAALQNEHKAYIEAMKTAGVNVQILPELNDYPDSIFVEDPALVFKDGAILLRPGALTRRGEVEAISTKLREIFDPVLTLPEPGFVEGGDVLVTPHKVMIGLSDRTDKTGAEALIALLSQLGKNAEIVQTPKDVLHFKTDCSLLDEETVFATKRLASSGIFNGFKQVFVPDGEEAAANALRVNDVVLVGSDFPKSIELLDGLGYRIVALPTTEIGKIDAGLSCMSLRWYD